MQIDELRSHLADAAGRERHADVSLGRQAVDRRIRQHRVRTTGAVALVVVVLLGAFGLRFGRTTDDQLPLVSGPSTVEHLLPTAVPDGVTFDHAVALPDVKTAGLPLMQPSRTFVYADATGPGALDGTTFGVTLLRFDPNALDQRATLGSTPGTPPIPRSPSTIDPSFRWGSMFPDEAVRVLGAHRAMRSDAGADWAAFVTSDSLAEGDLQRVADSLRPNADRTELDAIDLPAGFSLATRSSSLGVVESSAPIIVSLATDPATLITYTDDFATVSRRNEFVAVMQAPGRAADLDAIRWFLRDDTAVQVRGRDAVVGTFVSGRVTSSAAQGTAIGPDGQPLPGQTPSTTVTTSTEVRQSVVAWAEADGTLVVLQAEGFSVADLQRMADGLQRVDDAAWQRFRTAPTTLPSNCTPDPNGGGGRVCSYGGAVPAGSALPTTTAAVGG